MIKSPKTFRVQYKKTEMFQVYMRYFGDNEPNG